MTGRSHTDPKTRDVWWDCHCDCGTDKKIRAYTLLRQTTRSCGCLRIDLMREQYPPGDAAIERRREAQRRHHQKYKAKRNAERREKYREAMGAHGKVYVRERRRIVQEQIAGPKPRRCDVCGDDKARIEFDHCHQRGHFRGWLCSHCNIILGHARDNPDRLRKLIAYLERTRVLLPPQLALAGV